MIDLLLDALAAYRLTRLATADVVLDHPRATIIRFAYENRDGIGADGWGRQTHPRQWEQRARDDDEAPKLAEFMICAWCVGIWCSGLVVLARRYAEGVWSPLAKALALSAVAALMRGLEKD